MSAQSPVLRGFELLSVSCIMVLYPAFRGVRCLLTTHLKTFELGIVIPDPFKSRIVGVCLF